VVGAGADAVSMAVCFRFEGEISPSKRVVLVAFDPAYPGGDGEFVDREVNPLLNVIVGLKEVEDR